MRILSRKTLREFWEAHPDAKEPLEVWYHRTKTEDWSTPANVQDLWPRSSIVGPNRVVFRIKGNNYRMVVEVNYQGAIVFIRFIGTHAQYDRINVEEV